MKRLALVCAALLLLSATAAPADAGTWKGKEVRDGEILRIENPKEAIEKPSTVGGDELWRIGGEDDEEIFGVIVDIVAGKDGNFYMLDAQLNEIKVYDADGEYVRTIGREGEGPGEFRGAFNMFLVPGGNIGVLQTFPGKIVVLTPEGDPADDFPLPAAPESEGFRVLLGADYAGDQLAMIYAYNQPSQTGFTQKNVLSLVAADGKSEKPLHDQSSKLEVAKAMITEREWDSFRARWAAAPDGRAFACVNFGEYAINVWSPDGKLDRVITREYPDHVRTDEQKERLLGIYKGFTRQIPIPDMKYEIEDKFNQIQSIFARDNGELWVRTSRGANDLPDGVFAIFDVFDKQGRFTKQVKFKADGDPLNDGLFLVKDRAFVVTDFLSAMMALQGGGGGGDEDADDEAEPMQIISYQLD